MEESFMKWNPEEVASALKGKESRTKKTLDLLVSKLKGMDAQLQSEPLTFPPFDELWNKHLEEKNKTNVVHFGTRKKILGSLLAAAALFFAFIYLSPFSEEQIVKSYSIKIHAVSGDAYVVNSDGSRRSHLNLLSTLEKGDRLHVEEGSFVDLYLTSQSSIRIRENSDVILEKMIQDLDINKITIYLSQGSILAHIHKLNKSSQFTIRTEDSKVEVRGTKFLTEKQENGLVVAVSEGKVLVSQASKAFSQEIILNEELIQNGAEWKKSSLGAKNLRSLAELDYVAIESIPQENLSRVIQNEDDLYRIYSILERVSTTDGEDFRGVVFKMDESFIYIRTVKGESKIPRSKINEVEKIR
ncbi:MAG: FecR family protein [Leptospiraceae bacterium]|nr:FecR family protein [Leptospiraceae bacterium]MCZ8346238.1 FecR family protein [Leptospiraceae bacterium]